VSACGFSLFRGFVKKLRTSFHEAALITDFVIFSLCFFQLAVLATTSQLNRSSIDPLQDLGVKLSITIK
jgi:hypothetical protein